MATPALQQSFDQAARHHQAGRSAEAEKLYRQVLARQPNHVEALHRLGILNCQTGRGDAGVELIGRAVALRPNWHEGCFNLAKAAYDAGQFEKALGACRQAIALRFDNPDTHNNLGNILKALGRLDEAIAAYRQAIALRPHYPDALSNLGVALTENKQLDEAVAACRQAIALRLNYAEAHYNLGVALTAQRKVEESMAAYRNAVALRPNYPKAHNNLGVALIDMGRLDEAAAACRAAVGLQPDYAEAYSNLGNALMYKGQLDEAMAAYQRAIALKADLPEAHSNLGNALKDSGQLKAAIANYDKAIALNRDFPEAEYNLSHTLLLKGDFAQGWAKHERRWEVRGFPSRLITCAQPQWDGRESVDGTILLYPEQGFGDAIQFSRYIPLVAERCRSVIALCAPQLRRLLESVPGARWMTPGEPLPPFDAHCPLLSLPLAFSTTLETVPNAVPYLHADPEDVARWRQRFARTGDGFKVGLAWAGNPEHRNDRNRSIPLSALAPLTHVPGVAWFSLQKGDPASQAPRAGLNLIDWTTDLNDFADTAALIGHLDLVISADTAVVHLAGAMGKPVWTLLPFMPDWRWLLDRDDSPWYPTMRLFRQPAIGDWGSVIRRVAEALRKIVEGQCA